MSESPSEETLDQKLARLHSMMETVAEKATMLSQQESEIRSAIDSERVAYEERVAKLKNDLNQIADTRWDIQRQLRQVKQEAESIERQKEQMERVRIQQEQFLTLTAKWDRLVMGAPWREWAKDHQIEAGKRMANQRKLILADTMGLGKTLSALIALDYVKAMTEEASPEHPLVIDVP